MQRFTIPRDLFFGEDAISYLKTIKGKKAFIVIGSERLVKDGTAGKVEAYLKEANIESQLFVGIENDPSVATVMKGAEAMRNFNPDVIVGIGGGSPIDAAKAMWIFYEYPEFTFEEAAKPFNLRIEGPMDVDNRDKQIAALAELTAEVDRRNLGIELVADEWCNTLEDIKAFADVKAGHVVQIKTPDLGGVNNIAEAILYCNKVGIGSYSGGTCNETARSAEITTNIAMACGALQVLDKPGMGVDEGYMIVFNEMGRVEALVNRRK